jgi:hypothetical protein
LVIETNLYYDARSDKHQISVDNVVKAGCLLHDYLRNNQILERNVDDDIEETPENQLLPCTHTNSRSASSEAEVYRLLQHGSVPWQTDSISRGKY